MTPELASLAILWVMNRYPIADRRMEPKIRLFASALAKLSPASADAARQYVKRLPLDDLSPWRVVMMDSIRTLETPSDPNVRFRLLHDLSFASQFTSPPGDFVRARDLFALLDSLVPKP